jgi:uncharacterized membrane protein YdjX (TVP38/TMEM64 family)
LKSPGPHIEEEVPPLTGEAGDEGVMEVLGEEAQKGLGRERRQIGLLVLVVGAVMLVAHFTPMRAWLENAQEWKRYVKEFGWMSRALFLGGTALAVLMGLPRLPLCGVAGLLFGFAEGLVLSLVGSTLGSYGAFLGVRHGFRKGVTVQAEKRPWLAKMLRKPSLLKVFWVRQLVLPGVVLNAVLGVADTRHRVFLGGTFLGYIPLNVAATLVGSAPGKASLSATVMQLMAALAVINVVVWVLWRRFKKSGVEGGRR